MSAKIKLLLQKLTGAGGAPVTKERSRMLQRQRRETAGSIESSSSSEDEVPVRRKRIIKKKTSPQKRGMTLALTSGVFASFAGTFGKLAMNETETLMICEQISNTLNYSSHDAYVLCEKAALYLRILAFVTMILLNTVMWTTFVKALRYCKTSLEATVTNTAANFFSSAIVGQLIFDESVSLMWGMGTFLIICGLLLMNYGGKNGATLKERKQKYKSR